MMKRVTGIGGIFFKAQDPAKLNAWYATHLGIKPLARSPWGGDDTAALFEWRDKDDADRKCYSVFSPFDADTEYFGSGAQTFMFNFRVDDLDAVLTALKAEGVELVGEVRTYPYGKFAFIRDPEGNQIELWEPAEGF